MKFNQYFVGRMCLWQVQIVFNSLLVLVLVLGLVPTSTGTCNRRPINAHDNPSRVDENFKILIDGNPQTYIPGQRYLVTLSCATHLTFTGFTLIVENENSANDAFDVLGHFEIVDATETRFSKSCENMIENTNTNKKVRIDVAWQAPTNPDSGCIFLKAAIVQHRSVWFIDDGFLTKQLCPEEIDEINSQTPILSTCCACDEAKYEIILERKWNRNTHPKDFPTEAWRTRFSEVLGASHAYDYRFWDYGSRASMGLRSIAEHGSTYALEQELKENMKSEENGGIRTVIKAPGVPYRANSIGTTMAAVRVDRVHHLISFVSKIIPSPDWIIGVAGMELCLANCTWIESKILNLYPWDVGTDSGPSYMSPAQPQIPDVVRRITHTFPSDHRSPFFDESAPLRPLATLSVTRKKIYEKLCEEVENMSMECSTHPWNDWSECSVKCGSGTQIRVRSYKDPNLAERFNCDIAMSQEQNCIGQQCNGAEPTEDEEETAGNFATAECELSDWGTWSPCSKTCGKGIRVRTRSYLNPSVREKCQAGVQMKLTDRQNCFGDQCGGAISGADDNDDDEETTFARRPQKPRISSGRFSNPKQSNSRDDDLEEENSENERESKPTWQIRKRPNEPPADNEGTLNRPRNFEIPDRDETERNVNIPRGRHNNIRPTPQSPSSSNQDIEFCFELPTESTRQCNGGPKKNRSNYWFYDSRYYRCRIFTTDVCNTSKNKFRTLEECETSCLIPQQNYEDSLDSYDDAK